MRTHLQAPPPPDNTTRRTETKIPRTPNRNHTQILSNLPSASLLQCTLTSKLLHGLISQNVELQYILAKDEAGVEDNPTNAHMMSAPEKLAILKETERAWLTFNYKFTEKVHFCKTTLSGETITPTGLYSVMPNAYLLGCAVGNNQRKTNALQYARLPSRKGQVVNWKTVSVGKEIIGFGTSVEEHDLIALVCYRPSVNGEPAGMDIHLLRFSTGLEYSDADKHIIPVCTRCSFPRPEGLSISIDISGENLVLCVNDILGIGLKVEMFIYNWQNGTLRYGPEETSNTSLVFLRPDIFIKPEIIIELEADQLTLNAYYIPPSDSPISRINQHIDSFISLHLPCLEVGAELISISCRGDPSPRNGPSVCPSLSTGGREAEGDRGGEEEESKRPFINRSEDSIIIFTYDVQLPGGEGRDETYTILIFVPRDKLLNLVLPSLEAFVKSFEEKVEEKGKGKAREGGWETQREEMLWTHWGPSITRLFLYIGESEIIGETSGTRYVHLNHFPGPVDSPNLCVEIKDFSGARVRRCLADMQKRGLKEGGGVMEKKGEWKVVTEPTVIKPGDSSVFEEVVETCLPFVCTLSKERFAFESVFLDEERIINMPDWNGEDESASGVLSDGFEVLYFG
ncbi:hypothetical protein BDQ17DRAFT_820260 [Cyathus striatus]|nr:hypothetical protein BDQ17DRAFT_820260 [Cyathus striatus]